MRNIMMHVPLIKNLCKREMGGGGEGGRERGREGGSRGMKEQQEGRRREGDRGSVQLSCTCVGGRVGGRGRGQTIVQG